LAVLRLADIVAVESGVLHFEQRLVVDRGTPDHVRRRVAAGFGDGGLDGVSNAYCSRNIIEVIVKTDGQLVLLVDIVRAFEEGAVVVFTLRLVGRSSRLGEVLAA